MKTTPALVEDQNRDSHADQGGGGMSGMIHKDLLEQLFLATLHCTTPTTVKEHKHDRGSLGSPTPLATC